MKFLVTGKISTAAGPRMVMTLALAFLVLFTLAHAAREYYATGYAPATVRKNLYREAGGAMQSPRSPLMVLEDLHVDLFLYSVIFLVLSSLLLHAIPNIPLRGWLIGALFFSPLLYSAARIAVVYVKSIAYIVGPLGIAMHLSCLLSCTLILRYMHQAPRRSSDSA